VVFHGIAPHRFLYMYIFPRIWYLHHGCDVNVYRGKMDALYTMVLPQIPRLHLDFSLTLCWIGRGQAHVDCIWWSLLGLGPFRRSTVILFHVFDVCWMGVRQGAVFPVILSIFVLHSQTVLSVGKAAYLPSLQTRLASVPKVVLAYVALHVGSCTCIAGRMVWLYRDASWSDCLATKVASCSTRLASARYA